MDSNETYNEAFRIFIQWGPLRRIPVRTRWREAFPEVKEAVMDAWSAEFRRVEEFAFNLAEQVRDCRLNQEAAIEKVAERYPRLDGELVRGVYTRAYFHAIQ
jgi:ribosomal 50S subunit-associated protein YjgA (DUF615 family)